MLLLYAALSMLFCGALFSWRDLGSHSMQGGDPALNAWALQWVTRSLVTDPRTLFEGNAFHPFPHSIALSEHMLSLALFNVPVRLFTKNPWVGYNLLVFAAYLLSAVGAERLVRELTGSRPAALWAGIFFGFLYFRVHHFGHIQVLSFQGIPFVAHFLARFARDRRGRDAVAAGAAFALQALVSWYLAVIAAVVAAAFLLLLADRRLLAPRSLARLGAVGLAVVAMLAPMARPYRALARDSTLAERLDASLRSGDAVHLVDYLHPPRGTFLGSRITGNTYEIWGENTLYIGYVPLGLAFVGLVQGARRLRRREPARAGEPYDASRLLLLGVVLCAGGYLLAKGFVSREWGVDLPLAHVARLFPFVAGIRATQRFSLVLYVGVAILSSLGLGALAARARSRAASSLLTAGACLLHLADVYPAHLPLDPSIPFSYSGVDRRLAEVVASRPGRPPVVLHLPTYYGVDAYPVREATYMLGSTLHWAPVVNGFSGTVPHGFIARMLLLAKFPEPSALVELDRIGVDVVALHAPFAAAARREVSRLCTQAGWSVEELDGGAAVLVAIDRGALSAHLDRCFPFPVTLDLAADAPPAFDLEGFHPAESWGRWTEREEATVRFPRPLPRRLRITIVAHTLEPRRPVRLAVGESEAVVMLGRKPGEVSVELGSPTPSDRLRIRGPVPVSPASTGRGEDPRALGLGISRITVEPLEAPPAGPAAPTGS